MAISIYTFLSIPGISKATLVGIRDHGWNGCIGRFNKSRLNRSFSFPHVPFSALFLFLVKQQVYRVSPVPLPKLLSMKLALRTDSKE